MADPLIDLLHRCTVHVLGERPGAGFFVTPELLLTCAHVVGPTLPVGSPIPIVPFDATTAVPATLIEILPGSDDDLALLRLDSGVAPACVRLATGATYQDRVIVTGYPDYGRGTGPGRDDVGGFYAGMTEISTTSLNRRFIKFTGERVVGGFSGGPLLDLDTGFVIGVATETLDSQLPIGGWAVPAAFAIERFAAVRECHAHPSPCTAQWASALAQGSRRLAAWMAEPLPASYVARAAAVDAIVAPLLPGGTGPHSTTVSIVQFGGFGKTLLAHAVLHDARVRQAFSVGGALWVTLGQQPRDPVAVMADLVELMTGQRPGFATLAAATTRLRDELATARTLLVIDDVWRERDARPFLDASATGCARLLTSRSADVVPADSVVALDERLTMRQAIALLTYGVAMPASTRLGPLVERLGFWPLLLSLANGRLRVDVNRRHRPAVDALAGIEATLDRGGLTAFDPKMPQAREDAVALTIEASLQGLDAPERARLEELAIFPEDVSIPTAVIERLWNATAQLEAFATSELCRDLIELNLVTSAVDDGPPGGGERIRLHDLLRRYLNDRQPAPRLRATQARFVDAFAVTDWATLDPHELYLWEYLPYHLLRADRRAALIAILCDYRWLDRKLRLYGVSPLIGDCALVADDPDIETLQRTLRLAAHAVTIDPSQLALHLAVRLPPRGRLTALAGDATRAHDAAALTLLSRNLDLPDGWPLQTLVGHANAVTAVRLTPDGRRAVSVGWDGTLRIWDLGTGECEHVCAGGGSRIDALAMTSDGETVVSGTTGLIRAWSVSTGRLLWEAHPHGGSSIRGLALTPDGAHLLTTEFDSPVEVWAMDTGAPAGVLPWGARGGTILTITPDGATVIAVDTRGVVYTWDLATRRLIAQHAFHDSVEEIVTTPDGALAFVAGVSTVHVCALPDLTVVREMAGHTDLVRAVRITPDGAHAISVAQDQTIRVWPLRDGGPPRIVRGHDASVTTLALAPDGARAVTGDTAGRLLLWDTSTWKEVAELVGHSFGIWSIDFRSDGARVVSGSGEGTVRVWDVGPDVHDTVVESHQGPVWSVAVTPDGRRAISLGQDELARVWDVATGTTLRVLGGHGEAVSSMMLGPDGATAYLGMFDGHIRRMDVETGQSVGPPFTGPSGRVRRVLVAADERRAVSLDQGKSLRVWDLASGATVHTLRGHTGNVLTAALSPSGECAVSVAGDRTVRLWDLVRGAAIHVFKGHERDPTSIAYAPNGRFAVSGDEAHKVFVWDLDARRQRPPFVGHRSVVQAVAVTPDSTRIVSASSDETCRIWDVATGATIHVLEQGTGPCTGVIVSSDGAYVIAQSPWSLAVWDASSGRRLAAFTADAELMRSACIQDAQRMVIAVGDTLGRLHTLRFRP